MRIILRVLPEYIIVFFSSSYGSLANRNIAVFENRYNVFYHIEDAPNTGILPLYHLQLSPENVFYNKKNRTLYVIPTVQGHVV